MEDCNELGKFVRNHEIGDPTCKSKVHNNNVFEHLMKQFFESQNLESTPPNPKPNDVVTNPTLREQLAQQATQSEEALDRLSEEDTLNGWKKQGKMGNYLEKGWRRGLNRGQEEFLGEGDGDTMFRGIDMQLFLLTKINV